MKCYSMKKPEENHKKRLRSIMTYFKYCVDRDTHKIAKVTTKLKNKIKIKNYPNSSYINILLDTIVAK